LFAAAFRRGLFWFALFPPTYPSGQQPNAGFLLRPWVSMVVFQDRSIQSVLFFLRVCRKIPSFPLSCFVFRDLFVASIPTTSCTCGTPNVKRRPPPLFVRNFGIFLLSFYICFAGHSCPQINPPMQPGKPNPFPFTPGPSRGAVFDRRLLTKNCFLLVPGRPFPSFRSFLVFLFPHRKF